MRKDRWHMVEDAGALVVARRWPLRADLCVARGMPMVRSRARLAHQVRQDMWRALRALKGFSPMVRVEALGEGLLVTAGGQVDGPLARGALEARIAQVLECPVRRARWVRWAG